MYRLFVFEGDPHTTQALQAQLAQRMITTQSSASVQQAQLLLTQHPPHIVIFDLTHPLHEVESLYRWITTHPQLHTIPRVFLSLPHQEPLLAQLRQEGEQHIFERPLRPSLFFDALQQLLSPHPAPFTSMPQKKKLEDAISAMIGRKIGSFVLEKEIGRGGMGAVFRAHQEALQRKVALKIMLPNAQQDETSIRRFQREALAIAQLKSPHIVQIFDAGTTEDGIFYIVMEFLDGENIDQFLRSHKRLPELQALSVIEQVALGLKVAHDAGLIHRDIKPSNLIIDTRGQVTLTDFGLVRGNQDMSYTQPGIVVGSPHYLSPEQASGKPLDHRSDIYALGIVFFEILTGTVPFRGPHVSNVMLKHIQEPLPDPRQTQPDISHATVHFLQKMTQKEPAARYQDCNALLESILLLKHTLHPPTSSAGSWPGLAPHSFVPNTPSPYAQTFSPSPQHPPNSHTFGQPHSPLSPPHTHPLHPAFSNSLPPSLPTPHHAHPLHPAFSDSLPPSPPPSLPSHSLPPVQSPLSPPFLERANPSLGALQEHLSPPKMLSSSATTALSNTNLSPPHSSPAQQTNLLSEAEIEALQNELTRIIGPMAQIALKQAIKKLGHTRQQFPRQDGSKLLEALKQRLDPHKQEAFLRAATPHISSKRSP
ncbi:protein kinase [Myxococcota bacterium]|nr:protein kinase [Myxococcota bacterium]